MKLYNYKPYYSRRKNKKNKRIRTLFFLLLIAAIIIVTVKVFKKDQNNQQQASIQTDQQVISEIEPAQRNATPMPTQPNKQLTDSDQANTTPQTQPETQTKQEPEIVNEIPEQPIAESQNPATLQQLQQIESKAKQLIQDKNIIEARDLLNETLKMPLTAQQRNDLKNMLSQLADIWLFSDKVLPNDSICSIYKVKPGQVPAIIGKKYNLPWQFILKINNIDDPKRLWAGAKIKVVEGPFNAKIYRSTFTMDVFIQGKYVKSYKVGLGKLGPQGNPTPTGLWKVKGDGKGKLIRPPWPDPVTGKLVYYEDPEYPLGERWIGLDGVSGDALGRNGFGIHGTNEPDSIGKFASDGCIRMLNKNAVEFYDMVTEGLTEIQVVD